MKNVLLDTNVWLRFFLADNPEHFNIASKIFKAAQNGRFRAYISGVILMELIYVLTKLYDVPRNEVEQVIHRILTTQGVYLYDNINTRRALRYYHKYNFRKFGDCLIISALPKDWIFCSFDREFKRLEDVNLVFPAKLFEYI